MTETKYQFGTKTLCTQAEFDAAIKDKVLTSCILNDSETFYFVYGPKSSSTFTTPRYHIHLNFYDKDNGVRYTTDESCFVKQANVTARSEAINHHTFLIVYDDSSTFLLSLDEDWSACRNIQVSGAADTLNDLTKKLNQMHLSQSQTSIQKDGLSRVRDGLEGDFSLKSREGGVIKVHKAVLAPLWPFFKGLLDSEMKEASESEAKLDVPKSTLEVIIRYLYGQELELGFADAARLVVAAQMYDLPELLEIAVQKVTLSDMGVQGAIMAWRLGYEAKNDIVRNHCAGKIQDMMPKCDDFAQQVDDLAKEELQFLVHDLALSMRSKVSTETEEKETDE